MLYQNRIKVYIIQQHIFVETELGMNFLKSFTFGDITWNALSKSKSN